MRKKVLITGANGFLGFYLIKASLQAGLEVYAAIRKGAGTTHLTGVDIQYVYPDFSSISSLQSEIDKHAVDYIIHAAGSTKAVNAAAYNSANADLTYRVGKAAAAAQLPIKKFVFVSSLAALGPLPQPEGQLTETTTPAPVTAYGKSKLLGEEQLQALGLPLVIVRPTAIYGPREKDILIFFKCLAKGLEPYIGRGKQQLSFVHAQDVADAVVKALFSNYTATSYNISDGQVYDRYELATQAKSVLKKKTLQLHLPLAVIKLLAFISEKKAAWFNTGAALNKDKIKELTAANWNCSILKARAELGFTPVYNLKQGISETISWYKNNQWL